MWQEKNKKLYRKLKFKNFDQAFGFMQAVAEVAVSLDHHPEWHNNYNTVEIWLTTHSAAKITDKDLALSKRIDKLFDSMQSTKVHGKVVEAKLYTDGGSRGNPGPAATAFVICNLDDTVVKKSGTYIGVTTNNQAEYQALQAGLVAAGKLGIKKLSVLMDSELVVKQVNGQYKIKNVDLLPIYKDIKALSDEFESVTFTHVPRALNELADAEVNRILDKQS